jgi:hypothetical protein
MSATVAESAMKMHIVPIPIQSYRLLSMSMDDEGFIWVGSTRSVMLRYDPRSGEIDKLALPYDMTVSSSLCAGKKVYLLGQTYPRLVIYERDTKRFREIAYPSPKPDVWYGTDLIGGRYFYLFDRGAVGVIKWDTQTDTGTVIPWPYKTVVPQGGSYESHDGAIWCRVWDVPGGQYVPIGIVRLDLATDKFTGFYDFPKEDAKFKPFTDPDATLFLPYSLRGKLVPFDLPSKRWCKFVPVPRYGKLFAFLGGGIPHKGRFYFSLSTYNGGDLGCGGKPYHFLNAILEFDPQTQKFEFPTLEVKHAYYQIAYMLSANGEFYATGANIRKPDGTLDQSKHDGECVFWQSRPVPTRR